MIELISIGVLKRAPVRPSYLESLRTPGPGSATCYPNGAFEQDRGILQYSKAGCEIWTHVGYPANGGLQTQRRANAVTLWPGQRRRGWQLPTRDKPSSAPATSWPWRSGPSL